SVNIDQAWEKHSHNHFRAPIAVDMEVLIKTCLMPLAIKTQKDSFTFVHELKEEMHADLKYVESFENEIDELEYDKAEFSNMYDILLQEFTPHSWPQVKKSSFAKPYDVNAPRPFRNSLKHVPFQPPRESVGSNDMVHNYYLEKAKKKAQLQKDKALNTKPSVQQFARLPNTTNGNKPKPKNFNQQPRNWPPSMSRLVSNRTVNIAKPPRNQKTFWKSKDLACPTCKKDAGLSKDKSGLKSPPEFRRSWQTHSASKSQRTPSKNIEPTYLRRLRRLEDRSITKEKARRERSKSRRKRSGHQETSSDSEHEEGSEDAYEDLNSP
nr:hypothetical protein [Tanacetum cinerariifolium]